MSTQTGTTPAKKQKPGRRQQMIKNSLHEFSEGLLEAKAIGEDDVAFLYRDVLPYNLTTREEADVLIALDRALPHQCALWSDALVALIVDFVVWVSRPTGLVDADLAKWLVASLEAGGGPTLNGLRVAFEVIREADHVDAALLAFVRKGLASHGKTRASLIAWRHVLPANAA
jgi:hypothetical protein